VFILAYLYYI